MGIRWASVWTVLGAGVVALVFLSVAARGRVWAWVPFLIAAAVALREVRWLQRGRRRAREQQFDVPRR